MNEAYVQKLNQFQAAGQASRVSVTNASLGQCAVTFSASEKMPSVELTFDAADFSDYMGLSILITNTSDEDIKLYATLNNNFWNHGFETIAPGKRQPLTVLFIRRRQSRLMDGFFTGMNGLPDGSMVLWNPIDPAAIHKIQLYLLAPERDYSIHVDGIIPYKELLVLGQSELKDRYFPFMDKYGQFMHKDWPGKTHTELDMMEARMQEDRDLSVWNGPAQWSRYGGWGDGPQLQGTGHFRVEKVDGKWWFVDPDGYLFWSHGICCVRSDQATAFEGREHYFAEIPGSGDFRIANLARKYGENWMHTSRQLAHDRLRSWGLNTLANHSERDICEMKQTPYTAWIETRSWLKREFPDVHNPLWLQDLESQLEELGKRVNDDPWCVGVFVDNEIHGSMDPQLWERYFQLVSAAMKKWIPNKLYLGCRLDHHRYPHEGADADAIVRLSAKYCDVVSFNFYKYSLRDFVWLDGAVDKPAIIGEFHIGAPDRGLPHTGLKGAVDQAHRAEAYKEYVLSSLANPHLIGTHWFQYTDQMYTGRFDGENYQIGFVDICDQPYSELVEACRSVGYGMYAYRDQAGQTLHE